MNLGYTKISAAFLMLASACAYAGQAVDENWNIEQPRIELENFLERSGIGFFDLTPRFRQEAEILGREGKMLYFERDAHWNVHGHKLAGEAVSDFIKRRIVENSL